MKQRALCAVAMLLVASSLAAQDRVVAGSVYLDANGNGARDAGERGLAGIAVSNQDAVVVTNALGKFTLPARAGSIVFVSVPDGHRASGAFWRAMPGDDTPLSFGLVRATAPRTFSFVHASDTHIAPDNVARVARLRTLVDSIHPAFLLITGDLVRDALRVPEAQATTYYELFAAEAAKFATPVWTIPGNHENFGIERRLSGVSVTNPLYGRAMYHHYRGPDYYSFTYGGVHFVGLNTVDIDDESYYGHVDSLQLAWLERDLALVPAAMPVVTFDHIPFFSSFDGLGGYRAEPPAPTLITVRGKTAFRHTVSNAGEVLTTLRKRRHVLALGGHIHAVERITFEVDGQATRFEQGAAIVGPSAGSGMRFTSGVTLYTVRNGVVDAGRFLPLGLPPAPRP
ncbi:MAG: metallophosphoesterase [Gemmatimonadaceae bacterium]